MPSLPGSPTFPLYSLPGSPRPSSPVRGPTPPSGLSATATLGSLSAAASVEDPIIEVVTAEEFEAQTAEEVVAPDGAPGYDKVERLVAFLVDIREKPYLVKSDVTTIQEMWEALHPHDKGRIIYQSRHKDKLRTGRFARTKTTTTPGVDSVRRCMIGKNTGPATWPSSSRLVEAIFFRLCRLHSSPKKQSGKYRWSRIAQEYANIRDLTLKNERLMNTTELQLFEVNQRTLTEWYISTTKSKEKTLLLHGLVLPTPHLVSAEPSIAPRPPLQKPHSVTGAQLRAASRHLRTGDPSTEDSHSSD